MTYTLFSWWMLNAWMKAGEKWQSITRRCKASLWNPAQSVFNCTCCEVSSTFCTDPMISAVTQRWMADLAGEHHGIRCHYLKKKKSSFCEKEEHYCVGVVFPWVSLCTHWNSCTQVSEKIWIYRSQAKSFILKILSALSNGKIIAAKNLINQNRI